MRRSILAACLVASLCGALHAADHRDSPINIANPDLDITDVYVFRSPADQRNLVIAVDHQSIFDFAGGNTGGNMFATDAKYQTFVDTNGDLAPDITITTRFFGDAPNQRFTVTGLTSPEIVGTVTAVGQSTPAIVEKDGIKAFAGPRDDPFFFDLTAFNAFLAGPYIPVAGLRAAGAGAPTNFFRGNVAAIVLEIPISKLTGSDDPNTGRLRIWAKTFRGRL